MHTYMHPYMHAFIHKYIETYIHTCQLGPSWNPAGHNFIQLHEVIDIISFMRKKLCHKEIVLLEMTCTYLFLVWGGVSKDFGALVAKVDIHKYGLSA